MGMKKMIAALVLVMLTATVGCLEGPQVDKGGGESAVLAEVNGQLTGRIDVSGHVVNSGGRRAGDVVLSFKFFEADKVFLEDKLRVGDIAAGDSTNFSGSFFGPPVKGVFTWEYRIDWD